jgi:hypothetical protein
MPIRVTLRVKRGSSLPVNERAKKQRMTDLPPIRVNSEIVTIVEEVTVKTEEIDDGSTGESFLDILDILKTLLHTVEFEILPVIVTSSHLSFIIPSTH